MIASLSVNQGFPHWKLLAALLFLTANFLQAAPPAAKKTGPKPLVPAEVLAKLDAHTNLTYARYGARTLELDLYRPRGQARPLPAIVCIHGGGWYKGDRTSMRQLAQAFAARGYVGITVSYRLSGEAKFPAQIQDCKAAVRWARANASKYGIDPAAIGATGLSAGGHLAALLATSGGVKELEGAGGQAEQSSAIQACVAMGAQSDLESERIGALSKAPADPFYRPFLGGSRDELPAVYALASPRHHLDPRDPPLMFMCGELDDASTRAEETRRQLEQLRIPTGLKVIPQAPHAFLGQQLWFDTAMETCDAFFTTHLKRSGKPAPANK